MAVRKQEQQEAIDRLRETLKEGSTVYTVVRHVSRSGMMREIALFVCRNNEPLRLDYWASRVLGWKQTERGVKVEGCGMDMGFYLVYELASVLFPGGGKDAYTEGRTNKTGGYCLQHEWL